MCGRYSLSHSHKEIVDRFKVELEMLEFKPRYNIAPSQMVPVIIDDPIENHAGNLLIESAANFKAGSHAGVNDGVNPELDAETNPKNLISEADEKRDSQTGIKYIRTLQGVQWGLIPSWAKELRPMINARGESVVEKPMFRTAFKRRRCLIPADGFYEWMGAKGKRTPVRIHIAGGGLFAFAGLYEDKKTSEGILRTCTIITTAANDTVSGVHDRMPVILHPENEEFWLRAGEDEQEKLGALLSAYPSKETKYYAVSTVVNSAKNETPECIEPEKIMQQIKLDLG